MAEVLIKAVNSTHADPVKDRRACYKRGMPVVVMPDGHQWGAAERPPAFVVLKLPGISVDRVSQFIAQDDLGEGDARVTNRRRLWRVAVENLPTAVRNRWLANGQLTIGPGGDFTWSEFRQYLRNQTTDAQAPASI